MVRKHDMGWGEAVDLKSEHSQFYSEPQPQTEPVACTTAAELCLHHNYSPSQAKLAMAKMKAGLDPNWNFSDLEEYDLE